MTPDAATFNVVASLTTVTSDVMPALHAAPAVLVVVCTLRSLPSRPCPQPQDSDKGLVCSSLGSNRASSSVTAAT